MAEWREIQESEPVFGARVKAGLEAHKHKTLATLRRDGSPRISGTEMQFEDGTITFGSMSGAVKARDLQRDPRFAIHSAPLDTSHSRVDAKIAGRAVEVDGPLPHHSFRADVPEVVLTS